MESLIQHIQHYIHLSEDEIKRITSCLSITDIKKKAYLLEAGNICEGNYFVSKGCLRMYFIKENGNEQITQFAIENWWIADYMSLLLQTPSEFYIQAIENSEIIALSTSSFEQLVTEVPPLERYFRLVTQRAYAAAQFRIKFLYEYSRDELYHQFIAHFPEFVQRVPQYMLASYLGFTPEYLSKLRSKR